MIQYKKHVLSNGLRVIIHQDKSTPMAVVNLLYEIGSKDELHSKTGFAHLFEHLMFSGSKNVPDFDYEIELASGENNAFTSPDITNYFDVLPAINIETAIWLEADRMQSLEISKEALDIQKKVVVEEFYETCLNLPYGDAWHHIVKMAYNNHPYSWPTIGLVPDHIKEATLEDVQDFFDQHYHPGNAILVIAGNIEEEETLKMVEKWFNRIPLMPSKKRSIGKAIIKNEFRTKTIKAAVPSNMIYLNYGMSNRLDPKYYAADLLSDILSNGKSSRFYQKLVKDEAIFSQIDASITGVNGEGLFTIEGQLMPDISFDFAQSKIETELILLQNQLVDENELLKVKNKVESNLVFSDLSITNKAYNLAYYESLGKLELVNQEKEQYKQVKQRDILNIAKELFVKENTIILKYESTNE